MNFNLSKNSFWSICLFLITLYFLSSFLEVFIHKYIMHRVINIPYFKETAEEHIKHHIATNKDFSIKNNDSSNICFDFITILPVYFATVFILYIIFNKIISLNIILFTVLVAIIIHMVLLNTLHSYVHYFNVNEVCKNTIYGIPKEYINKENIYVKWCLNNHRAHHYFKDDKKGNWNIIFPGADYILGTHNKMPEQ